MIGLIVQSFLLIMFLASAIDLFIIPCSFEVAVEHTTVKPVKPKYWLVSNIDVPANSAVRLE